MSDSLNRIFNLVNVMNKNGGDAFGTFNKKKDKEKRKTKEGAKPFIKILLAFVFILIGFYFGSIIYSIALQIARADLYKEYLIIMVPIFVGVTFFITFGIVFSTFFLSTDNEVYLPLPVKPSEIFLARAIISLKNAYIFFSLVYIPFIIATGLAFNCGFFYYLSSVLYYLVFPLVFIGITFVIGNLISSLCNLQKHREGISLAISVFIMLTLLAFQLTLQFGFIAGAEGGDTANIIKQTIISLAEQLNFLYYIFYFPIQSFYSGSALGILFSLGTLLLGALFIYLSFLYAEKQYLRNLLGINDSHKSKRGTKNNSIQVKQSSTTVAFMKRDLRSLSRSPMAVFNLCTPMILFSAVITVTLICFSVLNVTIVGINMQPTLEESFSEVSFFLLLAYCIVLFLCSMSGISSSSISREGKGAPLIKTYPISPIRLVVAKSLLGTIFESLCIIPMIIPLFFIQIIHFSLPIILLVLLFPTTLILNLFNVVCDLRFPKYIWDNELMAFKNNTGSLISIFSTFLFSGIIGSLAFVVFQYQLELWVSIIIILGFLFLMAVPLCSYIYYKRNSLFEKLI